MGPLSIPSLAGVFPTRQCPPEAGVLLGMEGQVRSHCRKVSRAPGRKGNRKDSFSGSELRSPWDRAGVVTR